MNMEEKVYRVFVVNPGSTSTKVALFENMKCVISRSVFHDSGRLMEYDNINDQLEYRMFGIRKFLHDSRVDLTGLDCVVGRGGPCYACKSGTYAVDDLLIQDTRQVKGHFYHSSMLGVQLAKMIADKYGCMCLMVDPPVVDELCDKARITGVKGIDRRATAHVLNGKATGRYYAQQIGKKYEDLNLIIAHIDGGISISAHDHGRMIDANDAGGGEGPFTPTRMGSMAVTDVLDYLFDKDPKQVRDLCSQRGGLSSWFGTSDSSKIFYEMVRKGDSQAKRVWEAMIYQCSKWIAMMSAPLKGNVDAILLTGGLLRIPGIIETITEDCGWIAPVVAYPGEFEHEAMTEAALRVLRGEEEPMHYTGRPVFEGFDDGKESV